MEWRSERVPRNAPSCSYGRPPVPFCTFSPLAAAAASGEGEKSAVETCTICYQDRPKYVAVGRCGHAEVCWHCSTRLRRILHDSTCPLCKEDLPEVILARSASEGLRLARTRAVTAGEAPGAIVNSGVDVVYSCEDVKADVDRLFSYTCWLSGCGDSCSFSTLDELKNHLRIEHSRMFCDICLYGRNVFLHEQLLYDPQDLDRHFREGDTTKVHGLPLPPIPPHVGCNFCHESFYSTSELMEHMHLKHELCGICERQGQRNSFYRDAACLSQHYEEQHYVCMHEDCQRDSFHLVAFGTEDALRFHEATKHAPSQTSQAKSKKNGVRLNLHIGTTSYRDERERRRQTQQSTRALVESEDADAVRFMWPRNNLSKLKKGGYTKEWLAAAQNEQQDRYPPQLALKPRQSISVEADDKISSEPATKPFSSWRRRRQGVVSQAPITADPHCEAGIGNEASRKENSRSPCGEEGVQVATHRFVSVALQNIHDNLDIKDSLAADEYKARNRQFKLDLEAALGAEQLAEFSQHSREFRHAIAQACVSDERDAAVKTYSAQVLGVFSSSYSALGEARTATLLADLVVLLPDRDLRRALGTALRNTLETLSQRGK